MPRWDMDYIIGLTLRYGVIISIALILIGIVLFHVKGEALGSEGLGELMGSEGEEEFEDY